MNPTLPAAFLSFCLPTDAEFAEVSASGAGSSAGLFPPELSGNYIVDQSGNAIWTGTDNLVWE